MADWNYKIEVSERASNGIERRVHTITCNSDGSASFALHDTAAPDQVQPLSEATGVPFHSPLGVLIQSFYKQIAALAGNVKAPGE